MKKEEKEIHEFLDTLRKMDEFTENDVEEMSLYLKGEGPMSLPVNLLLEAELEEENDEVDEKTSTDVRVLIASLNLPGKVKLAMFGNAACRGILINDGNKLIQMAVLKNPKIKEKEIETFAKSPNMSSAVLRVISESKKWMKSYSLKHSIVTNPKTPQDVALKWFRFLNKSDLKKISRSRDVSALISTQAKKKLAVMERQ